MGFKIGEKVRVKNPLPLTQKTDPAFENRSASSWWRKYFTYPTSSFTAAAQRGFVIDGQLSDGAHGFLPFYRILPGNHWADEEWLELVAAPVSVVAPLITNPAVVATPAKIVAPFWWAFPTNPAPTGQITIQKPLDNSGDNSSNFSGFCTPCGGFRGHRIGCPLTKK